MKIPPTKKQETILHQYKASHHGSVFSYIRKCLFLYLRCSEARLFDFLCRRLGS